MKRNLIVLMLALSAFGTFAQNPLQNPNWVLTGSYLKFDKNPPFHPGNTIQFPGSITQTYPWANSYCDDQGNVLFFIIDGIIYDNLGNEMDRIANYGDDVKVPVGEIVVIPDPGNCKKYYIFFSAHSDGEIFWMNLYYTRLDLTTFTLEYFGGNRYQVLLASNLTHTETWTLAASKLRSSNNTRFLFAYGRGNNNPLYRYTISASQFVNDPVEILPEPGGPPWGGNSNDNTELELNEAQGNGCSYEIGGTGRVDNGYSYIWAMKLDSDGDYIPNSWVHHEIPMGIPINSIRISGVEFSPNGRYLYYTHETNSASPDPVEYLDLSDGSNWSLVTSAMHYDDTQQAQMELGADQRIYFAMKTRLGYLYDPDYPNFMNFYPNAHVGSPGSNILPDQIDGNDYYEALNNHLTGDFTYSFSCDPNTCILSITLNSTELPSLIAHQEWFLYELEPFHNLLDKSNDPNNPNPSSWVFSNLKEGKYYMILHTITDMCGRWNEREHIVIYYGDPLVTHFDLTTTIANPIDQSFQFTATTNLDEQSPCAKFKWSVSQLDANNEIMPGTTMTSNDNPSWLNNRDFCIFQGYNYNVNEHNQPGIFYVPNLYRFILEYWSDCNPSSSMTFDARYGDGGKLIISNITSSESSKKSLFPGKTGIEDFDIYPNPASDFLTIISKSPEGMSFTMTNLVGKVVIPAIQLTGTATQLDVSGLAPGIYLIRNDKGVTKKVIIQK